MKKRIKKLVVLLIVTCFGVSALAGCGSSGKEGGAASQETTTEGAANTADSSDSTGKSITLMASQNWIKDVDRELFKKFQDETDIEVKVLVTPDNGYQTLLGTTLAGGSNAVDIFMYGAGSTIKSDGITDVALDLSQEEWVPNLEGWAVRANSVGDTLYGFSTWGIDYEGILYNKTFFEENNLEVPTTWNDFIALCDKIKNLGVTPLYEGINGVWHTQSWVYGLTPAMYKEKADFVDYLNASKDNKFADIACFKEGLNQVSQLLSTKDGEKAKYYTNDGQSEDWFGSYTSLQNRETVMMFTYSAYAAELAANGATDTFGMFPVPLLDNQTALSNGGGVSKFINKNSDNVEESKKLLNFLAQPENLETYYGARTDLVTAAFKNVKSVKPTTATTEILERTDSEPVTNFIKDVLYWDSDVYQYLQSMAEGSLTPDQFITNIDKYRATMFDTAEE